ncbi:MAG TPA: hypothetical protein VK186_07380 [Candidatus Deferrimicrobium sp.]|nr:hypothetical protein [Candidatus Deferrimicrobium sp.]
MGDYSITLEEDIKDQLELKNNRVTLAPVFYSAWEYCCKNIATVGRGN